MLATPNGPGNSSFKPVTKPNTVRTPAPKSNDQIAVDMNQYMQKLAKQGKLGKGVQ